MDSPGADCGMHRPATSCGGGGGGGGGGGEFTFSDGLTVDGAANVTNDLVTGAIVVHVDANTGSARLQLNAGGTASINLTTTGVGDELHGISRDAIHTIGRNFALLAKGSGGATVATEIGNLTLDAGTVDQTAETRIMPRAVPPAATLLFRIWDGIGLGQQTILKPSGGTVVDVELRAVVLLLLEAMFGWGWLTDPSLEE